MTIMTVIWGIFVFVSNSPVSGIKLSMQKTFFYYDFQPLLLQAKSLLRDSNFIIRAPPKPIPNGNPKESDTG
jgi:hypothetical protein